METIATPAAVLTLAERLGYPRAPLGPPVSVPSGREAWHHFAAVATPALLTMPDDPPDTIMPRLL